MDEYLAITSCGKRRQSETNLSQYSEGRCNGINRLAKSVETNLSQLVFTRHTNEAPPSDCIVRDQKGMSQNTRVVAPRGILESESHDARGSPLAISEPDRCRGEQSWRSQCSRVRFGGTWRSASRLGYRLPGGFRAGPVASGPDGIVVGSREG